MHQQRHAGDACRGERASEYRWGSRLAEDAQHLVHSIQYQRMTHALTQSPTLGHGTGEAANYAGIRCRPKVMMACSINLGENGVSNDRGLTNQSGCTSPQPNPTTTPKPKLWGCRRYYASA